jgi:hypothetical protein
VRHAAGSSRAYWPCNQLSGRCHPVATTMQRGRNTVAYGGQFP